MCFLNKVLKEDSHKYLYLHFALGCSHKYPSMSHKFPYSFIFEIP
mgnify:FL=1